MVRQHLKRQAKHSNRWSCSVCLDKGVSQLPMCSHCHSNNFHPLNDTPTYLPRSVRPPLSLNAAYHRLPLPPHLVFCPTARACSSPWSRGGSRPVWEGGGHPWRERCLEGTGELSILMGEGCINRFSTSFRQLLYELSTI